MKLINVSNFLKQFSDQIPGDKIDAIELRLALLDEPAVEAIPIEWIKKWVETCGNEPVDDFTDVDYYCDGYQKNVIECLLKAWEKENEM